MNRILLNPFFIYAFSWIGSLLLYSINFTNNLRPINNNTIILVFSTIISFAIVYVFLKFLTFSYPKRNSYQVINDEQVVLRFKKVIKRFFFFWIIFSFLEIILFKGIPLVSVVVFNQIDLNYKEFGIPTLHGFLNSIYYTLIIGYSLLSFINKNIKYKIILFALFLWPVILMSRAMMLIAIVQFILVYILYVKIKLKQIFLLLVMVFGFVYIFGLIGDSRLGEVQRFPVENFVSNEYVEISEEIPPGFVWVYLYVTTPINNVIYNIDDLEPGYTFEYTLKNLIPSVIRDKIWVTSEEQSALILDSEGFNLSSYFANYLRDFGIIGGIVIAIFLQFIMTFFYFSLKKGALGSVVSYGVLYFAILTSVFGESFFTLVTISQILIGLYINKKIYIQKYV